MPVHWSENELLLVSLRIKFELQLSKKLIMVVSFLARLMTRPFSQRGDLHQFKSALVETELVEAYFSINTRDLKAKANQNSILECRKVSKNVTLNMFSDKQNLKYIIGKSTLSP